MWSDPLHGGERIGLQTGAAGLTAVLFLLISSYSADAATAADKEWDLRLALEERYDDNIIELSDDDIDRLEEDRPTDATPNRYSIETPDDFITIVRAAWQMNWRRDRGARTEIDMSLSAYQYLENPIHDYESYRFRVEQRLHPARKHSTSLAVSWSVIPDYYLRNLVHEESEFVLGIDGYRQEASFREETLMARLTQVLVPEHLRFEGMVGREERDYNDYFDERDSESPLIEAGLLWQPYDDGRLRIRLGWRTEDLEAEGDLPGTIFAEDDISQERDIVRAEVRFRWGPGGRHRAVRLAYEIQDRDYTTEDPNDLFHFGRHDDRSSLSADLRVELRKGWYWTAAYEREKNASDFPSALANVLDPDETTDFTANRIDFGFGYEFEGRTRAPKDATGVPGT